MTTVSVILTIESTCAGAPVFQPSWHVYLRTNAVTVYHGLIGAYAVRVMRVWTFEAAGKESHLQRSGARADYWIL